MGEEAEEQEPIATAYGSSEFEEVNVYWDGGAAELYVEGRGFTCNISMDKDSMRRLALDILKVMGEP